MESAVRISWRMTLQQFAMLWVGPGYSPTLRCSEPAVISTAEKPSAWAFESNRRSSARKSSACITLSLAGRS